MARTLVASDNFNRANGAVGANYEYIRDSAWQANPPEIATNKLVPLSDGTHFQVCRWAGAGSFTNDQYAKLEIGGLGFFGATYRQGVVARCSADTNTAADMYGYYVLDDGSSTRTTVLWKIVNGTQTTLDSASVAWANGDTIEIEVEGTTVRGLKNGAVIVSVTDTSLATGKPGFVVAGDSGGPPTADNWEGGNITGATNPTITDAGDEGFFNGETLCPITGTGFGTSQGAGKVYISPTDNVADGGRVEQTVTSWADTAIAFTAVKGSLSLETNAYLFVVNNDGLANAAGRVVQIQARPFVRETLVNEVGSTVNSVTGITMVVYHAVPTAASPNPAQVIENVSTSGAGAIDVQINRAALALNAPVWIALMKDGSPAKGSLRKVTPVYE